MFNLGLPELLIIGAVILLVFGPKRLPEFAKSLGKGIRDFKKALDGSAEETQTIAPKGETTHVVQEEEKVPAHKTDNQPKS